MKESIITPELKVLNFEKSLDFYVNLAGFTVLYDRPEHKFAMLAKNGGNFMIEELGDDTEESRHWLTSKLELPLGRGVNFQILVVDINNLYKKFKDAAYPMFFELEEKWYRSGEFEVGQRQFLVQDPDGYLLRFAENLGLRKIS